MLEEQEQEQEQVFWRGVIGESSRIRCYGPVLFRSAFVQHLGDDHL